MREQLSNSLGDRIRLFLQANIPDSRQNVSILDMLEMIDLSRNEIVDSLVPEVVTIGKQPREVLIGGYDKYKSDGKQRYKRFWKDVEETIFEILGSVFLREITLGSKTKMSTPLMVKRFVPVIIHPMIKIFQEFGPEQVIKTLGTDDDPFDWLFLQFIRKELRTSETDILIAQKVIAKYARGQ